MYAIPFPVIDPVVIEFGPVAIRWYALAYVAGLVIGWRYAMYLGRRDDTPVRPEHPDGFLAWATLGVVLGGRAGYVLFYGLPYFIDHPSQILAVWEGGMAFHGGLLGVVIAGLLYCRWQKLSALAFGDILGAVAPVGLFFGRIANFVNGELWGRVSDVPWAMVFPRAGDEPRHPSQLYEAVLEGLVLFTVVNLLIWRFRALERPGLAMGTFIAGYGISRFIVEFFRQWDEGLDPAFGWLSRGQQLSLPMIAIGLWFVVRALQKPKRATA
ncbi:MAG: prolipoprotein diacylglyceryl transferase [Pseudomonadota bacterium]|nr:prolipoprotein diacylglyceryl transferase [Pseudomonadota bacterium]